MVRVLSDSCFQHNLTRQRALFVQGALFLQPVGGGGLREGECLADLRVPSALLGQREWLGPPAARRPRR